MTDQSVLLAYVADHRAMIAALKAQRWDALKLMVGINLALAGAIIWKAEGKIVVSSEAKHFATWVAILGAVFVSLLTWRLGRVREDIEKLWKDPGLARVEEIVGNPSYRVRLHPFFYDWQDLLIAAFLIALSLVPYYRW